jgi:hypothetical protein
MIWDLVKTVEFSVPLADHSEPIELRIELFQASRSENGYSDFKMRAFRYDLFETKPILFSDGLEGTIPYQWAIEDTSFQQHVIRKKSKEAALNSFLNLISEQLGIKVG